MVPAAAANAVPALIERVKGPIEPLLVVMGGMTGRRAVFARIAVALDLGGPAMISRMPKPRKGRSLPRPDPLPQETEPS